MAVLQLSFFVRYIEKISDRESIVYLRYLQTITESAPQLCLQVYIMLRQWDSPTYTVVSSVLSLLSLTWSIMKLRKEIIEGEEDEDYKICTAVLFLIWQLSRIVTRLSAIVIFAYVFRYYAIIFLAAHWLFTFVTIKIIERRERSCGGSLIFSCLVAYISLFHVFTPEAETIVCYVFIILENIVMVALSLTVEIPGSPHMDKLQQVAILCLVGGSVISIVFIVLYYSGAFVLVTWI